ncbi:MULTISPECIES: M20 metallopeptidase family protein [Nitrosomonas]|uniref:Hippurate hydrolase n=2 Tax=Nitrosomonas communis TaxID=44574 RepID=A0A5D3YJ24_9PROT|nr:MULTISPECIES: M20 family metallopeptidase [Nitrosomonas]TYP91637.1 hippurate hydrolase [Nitrosomonas communis]UVS59912.1 M20 family metallopeptidase [Nitrosomonas sp. PLL12]
MMIEKYKSEHLYEWMVEIRRKLHRHPELAFEEIETAKVLMEQLTKLGISYDYAGPGHAVIGKLFSKSAVAPVVALRADMDALPGTENTHLPFASCMQGRMHACGHDAHMTMVLGAAALLKTSPPPCHVLFVFQPAEEKGGGARVVLESGALQSVSAIFGGHVTHHYRVGEIMVADGVITAQSDRFKIHIKGKGGHGARPHEATDAIVITGLLITALQTLVSREINPVYPAVVTIGTVHAGSAPNVIAEEAILEGSIRSTLPEVRDHIHTGLRRMAKAIGELHNAKIDIDITQGYPPVVNTTRESQIAHRAAEKVVGRTRLMTLDHPSMGSEDFSYYLQKIPGCYVRFGARRHEHEYIPLHSPEFDLNEEVLKVGAAFFDEVIRETAQDYLS